jgi:hypothetical protein
MLYNNRDTKKIGEIRALVIFLSNLGNACDSSSLNQPCTLQSLGLEDQASILLLCSSTKMHFSVGGEK